MQPMRYVIYKLNTFKDMDLILSMCYSKRTILKIDLQSKESKYISTVSHNDMLYRIRCSELDFVPCRTDI